MNTNSPIIHEDIAQRAHDIWEQSGRPEGHETEHWFRAENELRQERSQAGQFAQSDADSKAGKKSR